MEKIVAIFFLVLNLAGGYELKTGYGTADGAEFTSRGGKGYVGFLGIPFAHPPVGLLRFENPVPLRPRKHFLRPTGKQVKCFQKNSLSGSFEGTEDCLYLSIYTPKDNLESRPRRLLPVLAYIHGGGYKEGEPEGGASFFMDEDVVVVFINYRLGIYGFMKLDQFTTEGNFGIQDQRLALDWIQKYIHLFGGDPSKVTLAGESAGASSVHHHMLTIHSQNKFKRAILQSGSLHSPWSLAEDSEMIDLTLAAAKHVDCLSNDTSVFTPHSEILSCMKYIDTEKLYSTQDLLNFWDIDSVTSFVPTLPDEINECNKDIIIGVNSLEGGIKRALLKSMDMEKQKQFIDNIDDYLRRMLFLDDTSRSRRTVQVIKGFIFKKLDREGIIEGLVKLYSEGFFELPVSLTVKNHQGKVFAYYNDFKERNCDLNEFQLTKFCGLHTDELGLLFNSSMRNIINSEQEKFSKTMVKMWANFVKYGNPSVKGVDWKETDTTKLNYLWMGNTEFRTENGYLQDVETRWKDAPISKLNHIMNLRFHKTLIQDFWLVIFK